MSKDQHILIIGSVWPEPGSSAAGSRMLQLMELFQLKGYAITFACAASNSEHAFDVQDIGVEKAKIRLNDQSFDQFISKLQPAVVMFDRFMIEEQFGWRVAENCPGAVRILDTIDLHCLRLARQAAWKANREFKLDDLVSDVAKREIASILRCDISLIISGFEMDLLQEYFRIDPDLLHYIPFMLDPIDETIINAWPEFESRKGFITIGNFLHEPNWNAVQYLKEEIWPLIRQQLPKAELNVYGAYASQKVNELNDPKHVFFIRGRAGNAMEVVQKARVCLAPLRFGAGIKGKLSEAMQCGTPSVTTAIGAEGMDGNHEWSGIIANTAQEIADAAVKLYSDKNSWLKAQTNGVRIINDCYKKNIRGEELMARITLVQKYLKKHRLRNFAGAMLMHHSLASTKYMSKWIEEKNK